MICDEIIIGKDIRSEIDYAISFPEVCYSTESGTSIYHNEIKYEIFNEWFGKYKLLVFIGSPEYNILTNLVNESDPVKIEEFITSSFVNKLSPDQLVDMLINIERNAFKQGINKAQENVKKALGIE